MACEASGGGAACAHSGLGGVVHVESGEGEVQRERGLHGWGGVDVVVDWEECVSDAVVELYDC